MRPLFRGEGCAINEAGISQAGNPLSRALDAVTGDPLGAQQMRDGYLAGPRPPMMGPGGGQMMRPMMGDSMEAAWQEVGPAGQRMGAPGPMLGEAMPEQLRRHMAAAQGPDVMHQPGFFAGGPTMSMPPPEAMEAQWAREFAAGMPQGQIGPAQSAPMRPPVMAEPAGSQWAADFHAQQQMDMAFRQGQTDAPPPAMLAASGPASSMGPAAMGAPFRPMLMRPPMPMGGPMMGMSAPMHTGPIMQNHVSQPVAPATAVEQVIPQQETTAQPKVTTEQEDLSQAAQMVEMLRNSGNPKFANSKFVSFIDKVSKGDLRFEENTVVDRAGNTVDWDALYDTDAATATDLERKELEGLWSMAKDGGADSMDQAWMDSQAELEALWKESLKGDFDDEGFQNMFGDMDPETAFMDAAWQGGKKEYNFTEDNPYVDDDDPLALAKRLLREGRDREALLAFEAEVRKNPESSEGWRQLGELYAMLDQDVEAIQCLRKGHEVDPYNLESLLALGVSCTNELDQLPALRYLRMWIENHEDHQVLVQGLDPPKAYDYEAWRQQVTSLFNQAAEANPLDADVFVALGVMENINRNYDAATRALASACRLRPHDFTNWNKLGATLANSGKSDKAVIAYHQGLELKPNYARTWSNMAIAHANLGQHADAARFYLSSLVLNPDATHIWNYVHSAVLNMGDNNQYKDIDVAVSARDLTAMTKLIDGVLQPGHLPTPQDELTEPPDEILRRMDL